MVKHRLYFDVCLVFMEQMILTTSLFEYFKLSHGLISLSIIHKLTSKIIRNTASKTQFKKSMIQRDLND